MFNFKQKNMKKSIFYLLIFIVIIGCETTVEKKPLTPKNEFAIIIHGGAGTILKKNMTPEKEVAYKTKLKEAITVGYTILKNGGSSLDAVEKTINILENSPLFNAGKGAVFTNAGTNEMDASIMTGKDLNAGAIAGVKNIKNPFAAPFE